MNDDTKGVVFGEESIEIVPVGSALEALTRGEIDVQISTAKRYPRSIEQFKRKVRDLAMLDKETAAECRYAVPRGGKVISGPSVRFAEIVAASYGNIRVAARVIAVEDKYVVAQGAAHDLENNYAETTEIRRRITRSDGSRFNDDMIAVTANAACALARRNATFAVVPKALTKAVYDEVVQLALTDNTRSLTEQRNAMLEYWKSQGITEKQIFAVLAVKGKSDITLEHVADMRSLQTAIRDGVTTLQDAFSLQAQEPAKKEPKQVDGEAALNDAEAEMTQKEDAESDDSGWADKPSERAIPGGVKAEEQKKEPTEEKKSENDEQKLTTKQRLIAELEPIASKSPELWKRAVTAHVGEEDKEMLQMPVKSFTQRDLQAIKLQLKELKDTPESAADEKSEQSQPEAAQNAADVNPDAPESTPEAPSGHVDAIVESEKETVEKVEEEVVEKVEDSSQDDAERAKHIKFIVESKVSVKGKMRAIKEAIPAKLSDKNLMALAQAPDLIQSTEHLKAAAQILEFMPEEE